MTTYFTLKTQVKLKAGQILGYVKGRGYYAKVKGQPAPKPPRSVGLYALAEYRKHLGETEMPPGSNKTPFGRWFGVDGVPWCAILASYCTAVSTGFLIADVGYPGSRAGKGCAYVPGIEAWARATGRWRDTPVKGRLSIYDWGKDGIADHIGIVDTVLSPTTFDALEGNTAVGNDSNGGQVMRRNRNVKDCRGFVELGNVA